MITPDEVARHVGLWGVAPSQIDKDHMISHLLAAIAENSPAGSTVARRSTGLMDLANLARRGAITPQALARYRYVTGRSRSLHDFTSVREPTRAEWELELAHQLAEPGKAEAAAHVVHEALSSALRSA